jgi:hypothetical protein
MPIRFIFTLRKTCPVARRSALESEEANRAFNEQDLVPALRHASQAEQKAARIRAEEEALEDDLNSNDIERIREAAATATAATATSDGGGRARAGSTRDSTASVADFTNNAAVAASAAAASDDDNGDAVDDEDDARPADLSDDDEDDADAGSAQQRHQSSSALDSVGSDAPFSTSLSANAQQIKPRPAPVAEAAATDAE